VMSPDFSALARDARWRSPIPREEPEEGRLSRPPR
jgi:hypothetical protein